MDRQLYRVEFSEELPVRHIGLLGPNDWLDRAVVHASGDSIKDFLSVSLGRCEEVVPGEAKYIGTFQEAAGV